MEKITQNSLCPDYIETINKMIEVDKKITPLKILLDIGNIKQDEIARMEKNNDIFTLFPKVDKKDFLNFIENDLIKNDFEKIRNFLRIKIFWYGWYSVYFKTFFNESELYEIIEWIWDIFLVKHKDKLANEFASLFLDEKFNHFWFWEVIYTLYKEKVINQGYIVANLLECIIMDKWFNVSKDEKRSLIKPILLVLSNEGFSDNHIVSLNKKTIYTNISKFLTDDEIVKLATRFDYTIKYILNDTSLNASVLEKISDLVCTFYENNIAKDTDYSNKDNNPYLLGTFIEYLWHTNTDIWEKAIIKLYKLVTRIKNWDNYVFSNDYLSLSKLILSMYNCPKKLIIEVISSKNYKFIEYVSSGNSRNITKEDLLNMLELNHERITSNVMMKASQYGIDTSDILGF